MFSSPNMQQKRSRDEDESSPAKRTRVFGEYDQVQQQVPGFEQQYFQQQQQQPQAVEMEMEDVGMEMGGGSVGEAGAFGQQQGGFTQADISNPMHQWNTAPRMAHQYSTTSLSSAATSTMPGTPINDDDYDFEDDYGDCTYARPAPYFEESELSYPSESNPMAFTNHHGYTTIHHAAPSPFPGSTPTKGFGEAFPGHAMVPRTDLGGNEMTCDGARAYNWDAPRQHGHMV